MNKKLRKKLGIDKYLELIQEDKNLNMAYTSLAQYMYLLEHQLEEKDKVIDEAINFIVEHSRKEPPYYEFLEFNNAANLSELLEILERDKNTKI